MILRQPAVAGSFYSGDKNELLNTINGLLNNSKKVSQEDVRAIIVPHAGYVFSAPISATAFSSLHKNYKNIFIIGSSHHVNFDGVSIYNQGNYLTPLGEVKVNQEIVSKLISNSGFITYNPDAHQKEHTLEVQLPFLQTIYSDKLQIVPIIMATSNIQTIKSMSKILNPYFTDENLFIISTDLSHYPDYEDANIVDKKTLNALVKNNPQEFINTLVDNEESKIMNLQTSACGWSSLLTLLYITYNKNYKYELLDYKNSGDSEYGEKNRVVGYGALRVYKSEDKFSLTNSEKKLLLEIAKLSIYEITIHNKKFQIDETKRLPSTRW